MIDVLGEFIAKRHAHLVVAFVIEAMSSGEAPQIGHGFNIPDNNVLAHNHVRYHNCVSSGFMGGIGMSFGDIPGWLNVVVSLIGLYFLIQTYRKEVRTPKPVTTEQ